MWLTAFIPLKPMENMMPRTPSLSLAIVAGLIVLSGCASAANETESIDSAHKIHNESQLSKEVMKEVEEALAEAKVDLAEVKRDLALAEVEMKEALKELDDFDLGMAQRAEMEAEIEEALAEIEQAHVELGIAQEEIDQARAGLRAENQGTE